MCLFRLFQYSNDIFNRILSRFVENNRGDLNYNAVRMNLSLLVNISTKERKDRAGNYRNRSLRNDISTLPSKYSVNMPSKMYLIA